MNKKLKITFSIKLYHISLFILFILILSIFINDILTSYIASLYFITIPFFIGILFKYFNDIVRNKLQIKYSLNIKMMIFLWMIGFIIINIYGSILSIFLPKETILLCSHLSFLSLLFSLLVGKNVKTNDFHITQKTILPLILLILGILTPFWYLRRLSSFPLMLGADFLGHLVDIASINQGYRGISLIDDSFILLIGIAAYITRSDALWIFWSGPILQYSLMSIGIFYLSKKILNNVYYRIISSTIPLWFMGDGIINDLFFFLRRNLLMAFIPFFIIYIVDDLNFERIRKKGFIPSIIIFPIIYYVLISNSFYISITQYLPVFIKIFLQPGFYYNVPALTYNMPLARYQDIYVIILTGIVFFICIRKYQYINTILIKWYLISLTSFMINYRMGFYISVLLYFYIIINYYFSIHLHNIISQINILIIMLIYSDIKIKLDTAFNYFKFFDIIYQVGDIALAGIWSTRQKIFFLTENYGKIYLPIMLISITYFSIISNKSSKNVLKIISSLTAINLLLYFFPIPYSERFLVFVTPFIILLIMSLVENIVTYFKENNYTIKKLDKINSNIRNLNESMFNFFTSDLPGNISLIFILLIFGMTLTSSYDLHVSYYKDMYEPTGSISSFNDEDIVMAKYIQYEIRQNVLIISDPTTINILTGLSKNPYTILGRYYVTDLNTLKIISGRSDLFKDFLLTINYDKLKRILELYAKSDHIRGINSYNRKIVIVINNRTSSWINNNIGYQYANSFQHFLGADILEDSIFSTKMVNVSSTYLVYELNAPSLTISIGPSLLVKSNNLTKKMNTKMIYYDINQLQNITLSLFDSDKYVITSIPKNWILESIKNSDNDDIKIKQLQEGTTIDVAESNPNEALNITWSYYPNMGNITYKLVNWYDGWNSGSYSHQGTGELHYHNFKGILSLELEEGKKNSYCSIYRSDLNISINNETSYFLIANSTKNVRLAVAIDLNNGERIFLFNNTPTFFTLNQNFSIIKHSGYLGTNNILGIQIFILSTDGLPCKSDIKLFSII